MKRPSQNTAGGHRPPPPNPPIEPGLYYPLARLRDWGFGARGIAALQKAGLKTAIFGRNKFFWGRDLIETLEQAD